jgi:microcystin-dependent protein
MGEQYIGEIRLVGFNFQPVGWALCDGQLVSVAQNTALFSLLGTTYGGDGQTTFGLPDLRGRVPLHFGVSRAGSTYVLGQQGGAERVTLVSQQLPGHSHVAAASGNAGTLTSPSGGVWAAWGDSPYSTAVPNVAMDAAGIGMTGGGQAHENRPPILAMNFIIALVGIFPSRS